MASPGERIEIEHLSAGMNGPTPHGADGLPRVLVVGQNGLAQRLSGLLRGRSRATRVNGFLSAMGRVANERADVVIGPSSAMSGMAASTAESLRKMLPQANLVVVSNDDDISEIEEALASGFDHALPSNASDETVLQTLGLPRQAVDVDQAPDPEFDEVRDAEPAPVNDSEPADPGVRPDDASLDAAIGASIQSQDRGWTDDTSASPTGPEASGQMLGDTDLVEAVLKGQGELPRLAEQMVADQSGLPQVKIARLGEAPDPRHASAKITFLGQQFGTLHAPHPADDATLKVWADWLARWLALESQVTRLRDMSLKDELTGVWNRRYFNRFLSRILERAAEERRQVTVMVFDIDDFKVYNDNYGHPAGDEILREVARLMQSTVREHDVVARIGGDEFAVIFWDAGEQRRPNSKHPDDVLNAAKRFQRAVVEHRFPKLLDKAAGNLTISGGLAGFPWDGRTPEELIEFADAMAMRSKQQGKNAITFGPGAHMDEEDQG